MKEITPLSSQQLQPLLAVELPSDNRNPAVAYLTGLASDHTRRNMQRYLCVVSDILTGVTPAIPAQNVPEERHAFHSRYLRINWVALRGEHIAYVRLHLLDMYSAATINAILLGLRGTLEAAWKLGLISAEEYQQVAAEEFGEDTRLPSGRDLNQQELEALLPFCETDTLRGKRDAALIALLIATGMRRSELVALRITDFDLEAGRLVIRQGRHRQDRVVYLDHQPADLLRGWLAVRGSHPGAIFQPISRGDHLNKRRPMTPQGIHVILRERSTQAQQEDQ